MVIREISPELAKIAKDELNEEPGRVESDLIAIKEWLTKQPHINARQDDQWLVAFLRGCKFSLERTKEKLDLYYTMRTAIPELTDTPDLKEPWVQDILTKGLCVPLPKTMGPNGPRILIMRPGVYDASKISTLDTMRLYQIHQNLQMMFDDNSVIAGQRYIVDLSYATMNHFTQMTPSLIKKMVMLSQDAVPFRVKSLHHLNSPPGAETILNIFHRFMNEKNRNRFHLHSKKDFKALYEFAPKEILPTEYGGDAGPIQNMIDDWKKHVESHSEWLQEDKQYRTDESKRPGVARTSETLFGIEGSFRKLNVD